MEMTQDINKLGLFEKQKEGYYGWHMLSKEKRSMSCDWRVGKSQDHIGPWRQSKETGFYHKCHREPKRTSTKFWYNLINFCKKTLLWLLYEEWNIGGPLENVEN